jgi:hypothetical protein
MGGSTPLIRSVTTPAYMGVVIEASDGCRYEADLSSFSGVYCFPHDADEWSRVSIDSDQLKPRGMQKGEADRARPGHP